MKKLLFYIFIPVFAVLLMSHNVSAASETIYLKNSIYAYGIPANTGGASGTDKVITTNSSINYENNSYSFRNDIMWYSMAFRLTSDGTNKDLSSYTDWTFTFTYCSESQYFSPSSNDYFRITDYYEFNAYYSEHTIGSNTYVYDSCRNVLLRGVVAPNLKIRNFQLGTTANGSFTRIFNYNFNDSSTTPPLLIISPTIVFYDEPNQADQAIQEEKQNVQNATNNSQTSGNSSQTDSQNATSSLLSVFGAFANVITNATPTNCVIDAPLNTSFSNDRFNVDLCGLNLPPAIGTLTSIIAVMVVVPFAISMFNKFIGIMESFQK